MKRSVTLIAAALLFSTAAHAGTIYYNNTPCKKNPDSWMVENPSGVSWRWAKISGNVQVYILGAGMIVGCAIEQNGSNPRGVTILPDGTRGSCLAVMQTVGSCKPGGF